MTELLAGRPADDPASEATAVFHCRESVVRLYSRAFPAITLSKSISGLGLPMSLLLIRDGFDSWDIGDHPGTFRGQQLAFIGDCAALDLWHSADLLRAKRDGAQLLREFWRDNALPGVEIRCAGHAVGIDLSAVGGRTAARAVVARCFETGLFAEATGRDQAVVKLLPPLNTSLDVIGRGCEIIHAALCGLPQVAPTAHAMSRMSGADDIQQHHRHKRLGGKEK